MRTFLTVLGIVIGVSSIIIVFSAGGGIKELIIGQVESFGTNIIQTEITPLRNSLTLEDMEDVNKLPNITNGYGAIMNQKLATYGNKRKKAFLLGASASYIDIDDSEIAEGRFFTESEDKSLAKVVILGKEIKEKLFESSDALGKYIKLGRSKYRVIGIMEEKGAVMTLNFDDYIYIPIKTLQKRITGDDYISYMIHEIENLELANQTAKEIRILLRDNHDINNPEGDPYKDDFTTSTMEEMMEMIGKLPII